MNYKVIGMNFSKSPLYADSASSDWSEFYENQMNDFYSVYPNNTKVVYHFFDSAFRNECYEIGCTNDINDYIDSLAIKEGINFVKFESGNYGFVGTYGRNENGFEIMPTYCNLK